MKKWFSIWICFYVFSLNAYDTRFFDGVMEIQFSSDDLLACSRIAVSETKEILSHHLLRPGCVLKTPAILEQLYNREIEVQVDFEATWREWVDDAVTVNESVGVARIDIRYEVDGQADGIREFITPATIGFVRAIARNGDGAYLHGRTNGIRTFLMKTAELPNGASNVAIRIAQIEPKTTFKVSQIRIRLLTRAP